MKNKLNKFVPALIVAGVLALTVPFMTKAKADPQRSGGHSVAILISAVDGDGTLYVYGLSTDGPNVPSLAIGQDTASTTKSLLDAGFTKEPGVWHQQIWVR